MHFHTALTTISLLTAVALAAPEPEPKPYKLGFMSSNPTLLDLMKRQAGYQPTQHKCGNGATCADACGAGYITCPSNDGQTHCYDPDIKETCCPDGTGNSCSDGYFCTQDATGGTWCCPDGMSLAACAAAYSLTGTLVSETPTAAPTSGPSATDSGSVTTTPAPDVTTSSGISTVGPYSPVGTVSATLPAGNVTISGPSPTQTVGTQFTGAADRNALVGGFWGVLGVVGVVAAW